MANKKKRNKKYKGSTADIRPTILKVSAVKRHPVHQWWVDNQQVIKRLAPVVGIAAAILLGVIGLISIFLPR